MRHFAKVDQGKVINVIVAEPEFFNTFVDSIPGDWIETCRNRESPLRGKCAGIGDVYDAQYDVFYAPQPFPSWTLNHTTWEWEAPVAEPNDYHPMKYTWNESTQQWVEN